MQGESEGGPAASRAEDGPAAETGGRPSRGADGRPPESGEQQGTRRQATRRRVFLAAAELIAEQGFTATTVDAIAERANVAKGTVFYNFGTKDALFAALLDRGIELLASALDEASVRLRGVAAVDALVLAQLRYMDECGAFARVLMFEMWRTAWRDAVHQLRARVIGTYARAIGEAVVDGSLREDLDVDTAATAVFGMVLTVAIEYRALHPDSPLDTVHSTLIDLLYGRIGPAPDEASG